MKDWSGARVAMDRYLKKFDENAVLINKGLATHVETGLRAKCEEDLKAALHELMEVFAWLRR